MLIRTFPLNNFENRHFLQDTNTLYCNLERTGVRRNIAALISITLVTKNNGYNCICCTAPLGHETERFMISDDYRRLLH